MNQSDLIEGPMRFNQQSREQEWGLQIRESEQPDWVNQLKFWWGWRATN